MSRDPILKMQWERLQTKLSAQFSDGDLLDLDAILFLIGVQELGQLHRKYKKEQKLELMHIAICKVLEPYGYYKFDFVDEEGWPHYTVIKSLPFLKAGGAKCADERSDSQLFFVIRLHRIKFSYFCNL